MGAGRGEGDGAAVGGAVATVEGAAEAALEGVPAQSRVCRSAASVAARAAVRSRVSRFSYGWTEPEISFFGS